METLKVYERVSQGGLLAIQYIQKIESDYCVTAVDKLLTEIKAKMINIDSREWERWIRKRHPIRNFIQVTRFCIYRWNDNGYCAM